jgi:hypothetical protein
MNTLLAYTKSLSYRAGEIVELYTHYPSTLSWDGLYMKARSNQNVSLDISYTSIKCTIKQTSSTPGIIWNKIQVPPKSKYLIIRYMIQLQPNQTINISPYVRDLSKNVLYWISNTKNLIKSGNDFVSINLPDGLTELDISLLAYGKFNQNDSFNLINLSFDFASGFLLNLFQPIKITLFSHRKTQVLTTQTFNITCQKFVPNSFAFGCQWINPIKIQLPRFISSGYYFIKLEYKSVTYWLPIIVKPIFNLSNTNHIIVLANSNKWNAYNTWAGLDGSISLYQFVSTPYYEKNRNTKLEGTDGIKTYAPRVSNFVHTERPNTSMSSYIEKYFESDIKSTVFFNDHIYGEMFLPNYLDELYKPFDVITDQDMDLISISDISQYKIFIAHVHPEYWSKKQLDLLAQIHKAKIGIMYIGGNGLYWKCTWVGNQMEVRKDRKKHLDGTQGGQWGELGSPGEQIVKVYYSKMYPTNVQFGFPYQATWPVHPLLDKLIDNSGYFGFRNLNSKSINYGTAGWEVDNIQIPSNRKYLIAKSPDNLSNMIWKDLDTTGPVFSAGSIIYTGSLFVDLNIYELTEQVIKLMESY